MPWCDASAAATASLVESGFDAHSAMSAPPAFSVSIRLAVSLVTWRHAATRRSLSGCSLANRSRMRLSTGISRAAQSTRSWPCVARFRSFTSLPRELTFKSFSLLVDDLALQLDVLQLLAAVEVAELDQHLDADHVGAELAHQADGGGGRASSRQNIIDDKHLLTGLDRVGVDLELVGAVLEVVRLHDRHPRQLARLTDGDEAGVEPDRHRRARYEAPRLDAGDEVRRIVEPGFGHQLDHLAEDPLVAEERRDVAEDDALLRVVGHVADVLLQVLGRGQLGITERKYSRVFASPSSSPTSGCQPSNCFALVMSGRRCFGSSAGSSRCSMPLFDPASLMIVLASSSTVTSCGLPRLTGSSSPRSRAAMTPRTRSE